MTEADKAHSSHITEALRGFIKNNFLFTDKSANFDNDDSFVERGIIDSTGVMELVSFIESKWKFKLADEELVPENLDSVNNAATFIASKQGA